MRKLVSVPKRQMPAHTNVLPLVVLAILPQTVNAQNVTGSGYSEAETSAIVAGAMIFVVLVGVLIGIACVGGMKSICERNG